MKSIGLRVPQHAHPRSFCRLLCSLLLQACCYALALGLRFDFAPEEFDLILRVVLPLGALLLSRTIASLFTRVHERRWSYVSLRSILAWAQTLFLGSLIFAAVIGMLRVPSFPRAVIAIEFLLSLLAVCAAQVLTRVFHERGLQKREESGPTRQVVVLGAGAAGELLIKQLLSYRGLGFEPVALLDDSERLHGLSVHGVPVEGKLAELEATLSLNPQIHSVFSAIPSLSPARISQLKILCEARGVNFRRLQSFEEILLSDTTLRRTDRERFDVSQLLEREHIVESREHVREILRGRTVLVTGAGGSIGSELVRQILQYGPQRVAAVDSSEFNLFTLKNELQGRFGEQLRCYIGNISDVSRLLKIFREVRPDLVFHAAAYKHVAMMEENSYEAYTNNILGTLNLLEVSAGCSVSNFILISSDKAVDPKGLMGASKRIAELLVLEYAQNLSRIIQARNSRMRVSAVRFGNVLNSSGSVVPIFLKQIESGGPLTVTHPDMERYFMSIREAVSLVLSAAALDGDGEIYVLNMGEPVKILDLAKRMLSLLHREDIPIILSGLRPGEQLRERITSDSERLAETQFRKILRVEHEEQEFSESILNWVLELKKRVSELDEADVKQAILEMAQRSFDAGENAPRRVFTT